MGFGLRSKPSLLGNLAGSVAISEKKRIKEKWKVLERESSNESVENEDA